MNRYTAVIRDMVFFIALMATALALGGALAHAMELPNKMGLTQQEYFTAQKLYLGWNRLAYLLAVELAGIVAVVYLYRRSPEVWRPAVAGLLFFFAAQVVFWVWTFPANVATKSWTLQPENWQLLRAQWEYSHLAGAVFQTLVMAALLVAVLQRGRPA